MEEQPRRSFHPLAVIGAAASLLAVIAGLVTGVRAAVRVAALVRAGLRAGWAAVTLRLYRRCPDCRRWTRGDALVCWRCGWRRPGRRWPRHRSRF